VQPLSPELLEGFDDDSIEGLELNVVHKLLRHDLVVVPFPTVQRDHEGRLAGNTEPSLGEIPDFFERSDVAHGVLLVQKFLGTANCWCPANLALIVPGIRLDAFGIFTALQAETRIANAEHRLLGSSEDTILRDTLVHSALLLER
jgi:hypothetical protein